jgi:RNA polymerase sigma factor (sigma-70 family)
MLDPLTSSPPGGLSVEELALRCQQEHEKFLAGSDSDEAYGLELFHRALFDHDQVAWQAIYAQYQPIVDHWIRCYSRFRYTNEEAAFFVNAAFTRFWQAVSRWEIGARFDTLPQLLGYLKCCVHSAIEDECRRQQRWSRGTVDWDEFIEFVPDAALSVEEHAIGQVARDILEWAVRSRLQDEKEEVIATLSWVYGLPPSEIQARHPDLFADVRQIYKIKQNILSRLQRDPRVQYLRKHIR